MTPGESLIWMLLDKKRDGRNTPHFDAIIYKDEQVNILFSVSKRKIFQSQSEFLKYLATLSQNLGQEDMKLSDFSRIVFNGLTST